VGVREWMREVDAECAACGEEGSMEEEGFEGLVEGKVFGVGSRLLGVERKTSLFGDEEVVGESDEVARSYGLDLEGAGVVEGESLDGGGGVKGEGGLFALYARQRCYRLGVGTADRLSECRSRFLLVVECFESGA
jgi:hypothetical protein